MKNDTITPAPATQEAAQANPLSDEYVNAVIQRHGYQSPEAVVARLYQWISLHGGEDSVTLLMYEAHKALSKLRAPIAREAQKGWRLVPEKLTEEMRTAGEVVRSPSGTVSYGLSRHALALAWDALLSAAPSPPATYAALQASVAINMEDIARQWDGCAYDAPGGPIDIGEAIRTAAKRNSVTQASEAVRDAGVAASAHQLAAAAKVMTKLYPYVWDRTDGSLVVFPENVAKFDAAFDALRVALAEAIEDDDSAALSAQPGAQKNGGSDA